MQNTLESSGSDILNLNCWVLGDHRPRVFSVKIARSEMVDALKDEIKIKKKHTFLNIDANRLDVWKVSSCRSDTFDDITADSLDLSKVSIPVNRDLRVGQTLQTLFLGEELLPVTRLSKVFSYVPEEGHLHIVVKAPPGGECRCSCMCGAEGSAPPSPNHQPQSTRAHLMIPTAQLMVSRSIHSVGTVFIDAVIS